MQEPVHLSLRISKVCLLLETASVLPRVEMVSQPASFQGQHTLGSRQWGHQEHSLFMFKRWTGTEQHCIPPFRVPYTRSAINNIY